MELKEGRPMTRTQAARMAMDPTQPAAIDRSKKIANKSEETTPELSDETKLGSHTWAELKSIAMTPGIDILRESWYIALTQVEKCTLRELVIRERALDKQIAKIIKQ